MTLIFSAQMETDLSEWSTVGPLLTHSVPGLNSTAGKMNGSVGGGAPTSTATKNLTPFIRDEVYLSFYLDLQNPGTFGTGEAVLCRVNYENGDPLFNIVLVSTVITQWRIRLDVFEATGSVATPAFSVVATGQIFIEVALSSTFAALWLDGTLQSVISFIPVGGNLDQVEFGVLTQSESSWGSTSFFDEVLLRDDFSLISTNFVVLPATIFTFELPSPEVTAGPVRYQINGLDICGVQSIWSEIVVRTNPNGTKQFSTWALCRWSIPLTTQDVWQALELVEGQSVTIATNRYDNRNEQAVYSGAQFMGVANQIQSGIQATSINVEFRVKI